MTELSRKTKVISISLPQNIAEQLEDMTKSQGKTKTDLFKEMFKNYNERIAEKEWAELFKFGKETAEKFEIRDEEELFKILNE